MAEWRAYTRVEPWGEERADWRSAIEANTVARCHGNKTEPKQFLLRFEKDDAPQKRKSPAEILAIFKGLAARKKCE